MSMIVGVIGLGPMGGNIAGNLLARDFEVIGFDLIAERIKDLEKAGLEAASSIGEVSQKADVLIASAILGIGVSAAASLTLTMNTQEDLSWRVTRGLNLAENAAVVFGLGLSATDAVAGMCRPCG